MSFKNNGKINMLKITRIYLNSTFEKILAYFFLLKKTLKTISNFLKFIKLFIKAKNEL
jgi:hypothetical protein